MFEIIGCAVAGLLAVAILEEVVFQIKDDRHDAGILTPEDYRALKAEDEADF